MEGLQRLVEEWVGQPVRHIPVFGLARVYERDAVVATHVDRPPLAFSCEMTVAHDAAEDWPLEVYDWQGVAHNLTSSPGQVSLYEVPATRLLCKIHVVGL